MTSQHTKPLEMGLFREHEDATMPWNGRFYGGKQYPLAVDDDGNPLLNDDGEVYFDVTKDPYLVVGMKVTYEGVEWSNTFMFSDAQAAIGQVDLLIDAGWQLVEEFERWRETQDADTK